MDGATGIARKFHRPGLLTGAAVVSIVTTLPEVMVSTTSALTGYGEIAYGNAIDSVICNAALIRGKLSRVHGVLAAALYLRGILRTSVCDVERKDPLQGCSGFFI